MHAQSTTRMSGPGGLIIGVLAIALAVLAIALAGKISDPGEMSGTSHSESGAQVDSVEVAPANANVAPSVGTGASRPVSLIDNLRFLEMNTVLPGYGSAVAKNLSIEELFFLEANTQLPGPKIAPGNQLLASEMLFLESNLYLPESTASEKARSAEETAFIEMNTILPEGGKTGYTGKLSRE